MNELYKNDYINAFYKAVIMKIQMSFYIIFCETIEAFSVSRCMYSSVVFSGHISRFNCIRPFQNYPSFKTLLLGENNSEKYKRIIQN